MKNKFIYILFALNLFLSLFYFRNEWLLLLSGGDKVLGYVDVEANEKGLVIDESVEVLKQEKWVPTPQGLALNPHEKAILILKYEIPQEGLGSSIGLQTWFSHFIDLETKVFVQGEKSQSFHRLGANRFDHGSLFNLTPYLSPDERYFTLTFVADYDTDIRQSLYASFVMARIYYGGMSASGGIAYSLLLILLPLLIRSILRNLNWILTMCAMVLFWGLNIIIPLWLPYGAMLLIICLIIGLRKKINPWVTLSLLILGIGIWFRWQELILAQIDLLAGDAKGYADIAREMRFPYDTQYREPFFPWLVWIYQKFFGSTYFSARLVSFSFSSLLIWLTFRVAKDWLHPVLALLVQILVAFNPWFIHQCVRGLRFELFTCFILIVGHYFVMCSKPLELKDKIILILVSAFLPLLRLPALFPLGLLCLWGKYSKKISWTLLGVLFFVMLGTLMPSFIYFSQEKGDALYTLYRQNSYYQGYEEKGNLLARTWKDFKLDKSPEDKKLELGQYIFGMHRIRTVIKYSWEGLIGIMYGVRGKVSYFKYDRFIPWLVFFGLLFCLLTKDWAVIVFILIWTGPIVFLVSTHLFFDPRLFAHNYPYLCIMALIPIDRMFKEG